MALLNWSFLPLQNLALGYVPYTAYKCSLSQRFPLKQPSKLQPRRQGKDKTCQLSGTASISPIYGLILDLRTAVYIYIYIYIILPFCWLVNPHMTTLLIASSLCPPIHLKPSLSFYVPKTFSVSTPNLGLSVQIIYPGPGLPSLSRQGTVPLANVPEALGISSKQLVCSMSLAKVGVHPVVFREKLV
jgi:hypothetical protein